MNIADIVTAVLVLGGSALALTAAIGVVRFPDTLSRMHAATKPQVLGLLLVLAGAAIRLRGNVDVGMLILTGIFTVITAPVVANRVGQLAYREQNIHDTLTKRRTSTSTPKAARMARTDDDSWDITEERRRDRAGHRVGAVPGVDVGVPAVHRPYAEVFIERPSRAAGNCRSVTWPSGSARLRVTPHPAPSGSTNSSSRRARAASSRR